MDALWTVDTLSNVDAALGELPDTIREEILDVLEQLTEDPFPPGSLELRGHPNVYRIRLDGYRMVYEVNPRRKRVLVTRLLPRGVVYRGLEPLA